jgi:hypothetical protein
MCRGMQGACPHRLDYEFIVSFYANFIVKKWPLYLNFSIPLYGN